MSALAIIAGSALYFGLVVLIAKCMALGNDCPQVGRRR